MLNKTTSKLKLFSVDEILTAYPKDVIKQDIKQNNFHYAFSELRKHMLADSNKSISEDPSTHQEMEDHRLNKYLLKEMDKVLAELNAEVQEEAAGEKELRVKLNADNIKSVIVSNKFDINKDYPYWMDFDTGLNYDEDYYVYSVFPQLINSLCTELSKAKACKRSAYNVAKVFSVQLLELVFSRATQINVHEQGSKIKYENMCFNRD